MASLACVGLGLRPTKVHDLDPFARMQVLYKEKERKLELARNKWIQDMETLPGPHRELACDSTGHCFYPGVQGFFERGQGLVVCKDCTDPTIEGSYSKWRTWGVSEFIFSPVVGQFPPGSAQGLVNLSRSKGVCNIVAPAFNPLH